NDYAAYGRSLLTGLVSPCSRPLASSHRPLERETIKRSLNAPRRRQAREENVRPAGFEDRQQSRREPSDVDGQPERVASREGSHQFCRSPPSEKDGTINEHVQVNITRESSLLAKTFGVPS